MSGPRLRDVGEDPTVAAAIAAVTGGPGTGPGPAPGWLVTGPGDDAAVLDVSGRVVVSTDTLVEDRDFRLAWCGGRDVGIKAAAQNFADVAAMGARPLALLVALAAPAGTPAAWAADLAAGLADECARAGARVVGGDVSGAAQIVVTGTALGLLDGVGPVLRSGARPGDVVALAGAPGRSAGGLAALRALGAAAAADPLLGPLVGDHLRPRPPYQAGVDAARAGATAMIDTSDGLVRDAARIAGASGVTVELEGGVLDALGDLAEAAGRLGADAREWIASGGEDHGMLACFPDPGAVPRGFAVIGWVSAAGPGGAGVLLGGRPWAGSPGYRHFDPEVSG